MTIVPGLSSIEQEYYNAGRFAWAAGKGMDTSTALSERWKSWYRAGWIDADIEGGNRIYNGPERPRRAVA